MRFVAIVVLTVISQVIRQTSAETGSLKLVVVGQNETAFLNTIDDIALFIAKNHSKAVQVFDNDKKDPCEFIGTVDRAKMPSDFILIVKRFNDSQLKCDAEWGRQSFGIMNFWPDAHNSTSENVHFKAKIIFQSTEADTPLPKWINVTSGSTLLNLLMPKFLPAQSRIPDEYPFKAEREQRVKQRTLKAICALMALTIVSLLVILFLGSLSRFNEAKKLRLEEEQRVKKKEEQTLASVKKSAESGEKSGEKSEKSEKKSVKNTEKSAKKED